MALNSTAAARCSPADGSSEGERGIALLLTVFVIALATILVMELVTMSKFDTRASRGFAEEVQSDYILRSGLNLGKLLLEIPKRPEFPEDWLGEPWALIGSAPTLPISGFIGTPQLAIVDEDGKIDLNSILGSTSFGGFPGAEQQAQTAGTQLSPADYWKTALRELFTRSGFVRAQYPAEEFKTPGNQSFDPAEQVAVVHDFIDSDTAAHNSPSFSGVGIESSGNATLFYNRPLKTLAELLLVPGITADRWARLGPLVRVGLPSLASSRRINVNTAPLEVLTALGFPENQAAEIFQQRQNLPITNQILTTLVQGDPQLSKYTKVTSTEFSVFVRVQMPTMTRWMKAKLTVQGTGTRRRAQLNSIEYL